MWCRRGASWDCTSNSASWVARRRVRAAERSGPRRVGRAWNSALQPRGFVTGGASESGARWFALCPQFSGAFVGSLLSFRI
jgi:hypothetical protein